MERPVMRSFDVFFDLCLNTRLSKQWWGWWFETLLCSLWRHSNANTWRCLVISKHSDDEVTHTFSLILQSINALWPGGAIWIMDNSYPRQLVPRATRIQDNSYPGQLVPKTTRTQDNSYPRQLVPKTTRTQDNSYPGQLVPRTTRTQQFGYYNIREDNRN